MRSPFPAHRADFYLDHPDAASALLRDRNPIHWYEEGGFWCVTRHADVREIFPYHPKRAEKFEKMLEWMFR